MPLILAALLACSRVPTDALTWQESWEILAITDQGALLDGRASFANTGWLRGQARLQVDLWSPDEGPIGMARDALPAASEVNEERDQVQIGGDSFGRFRAGDPDSRWTLRFGSLDSNAVVHLEPEGPPASPAAWQEGGGQWTLTAPVTRGRLQGWIEADKRGGPLEGRGILLHRGGDGQPRGARTTLLALGADTTICWDGEGSGHLAWATVDGRALDSSAASLAPDESGAWVLDLRPAADLLLRFEPGRAGGARDRHAGLSGVELNLLRRLDVPLVREVRTGQATVSGDGRSFVLPALLLREG